MGERCAAYIRFGGRISRDKADELIELLNDQGYGVYGDGSEADRENLRTENFGDYEINYGNLDELKEFATANGLHYLYWSDRGSEWDQSIEIYDPEAGTTEDIMDSENGPVLRRKEIEKLGSMEAILRHFDKFDEKNLPTLEIVP
jgi:hypothetical protein